MDETPKDGRSSSQKTPEEIRAERIAAVEDPQVRQELERIARTRDEKLAEERENQVRNNESSAEKLRDQKYRSANGLQLLPPGITQSRYRGPKGYTNAEHDAKAEIQKLTYARDDARLKDVAKEFNTQIDKGLDVYRENQAVLDPSASQARAAERQHVLVPKSRQPNRYAALVAKQNYAASAPEIKQDPTRQPPRDRSRER